MSATIINQTRAAAVALVKRTGPAGKNYILRRMEARGFEMLADLAEQAPEHLPTLLAEIREALDTLPEERP